MELTKEQMLARTWVKLTVPTDNWPNPKSTVAERTFVTTCDGVEEITMREDKFLALMNKHGLVPFQ